MFTHRETERERERQREREREREREVFARKGERAVTLNKSTSLVFNITYRDVFVVFVQYFYNIYNSEVVV